MPKLVSVYHRSGKRGPNGAADAAAAICEALSRPNPGFVPIQKA